MTEFVTSIQTWPQAFVATVLILTVPSAFCFFFWMMLRD